MIKRSILFDFAFKMALAIVHLGFMPGSMPWQDVSRGILEREVIDLMAVPDSGGIIFAVTDRSLYRQGESEPDFKRVFQGERFINISMDEQTGMILLTTRRAVYKSLDYGESWQVIFRSFNSEYESLNRAEIFNNKIFLASSQGLKYKKFDEDSWHSFDADLGREAVFDLSCSDEYLFVVSSDGIYRLNPKERLIERVFRLINANEGQNDDEQVSVNYGSERQLSLSTHRNLPGVVCLASGEGIYLSRDYGNNWKRFPESGISLSDVYLVKIFPAPVAAASTRLTAPPASEENVATGPAGINHESEVLHGMYTQGQGFLILAGTRDGLYEFNDGSWKNLYKGLRGKAVLALDQDSQGQLYAGTSRGLFLNSFEQASPIFDEMDKFEYLNVFRQEPGIQELQKIAMYYAEVHPEKISDWRVRTNRKAWLPSLRLGLGIDNRLTVSDTVYGSYTGGGQHHVGPDDKSFNNNLGFDVSLSWDFSNLIWSSDQTSIDTRSKLMVELRERLLDQLTRIYFERRRLQIEVLQNYSLDKQLRIEELTALLDALTGWEFSKRIEAVADRKR